MRLPKGSSTCRYKLIIVSLVCAVLSLIGGFDTATAGQTTGNKYVTALVEDGSGLIWFLKGKSINVPPSVQLSFRDKSFLSLKVAGKVYSNNNASSLVIGKQDVDLDNGTNTVIGDTIETVWPEAGFDIVQDVYPVEFEISGQIVYRVRVVNHSGGTLNVQAQYLLDVDVHGNDGAQTLTRYNYSPNWLKYPNTNHGIPWFFLGFQNPPTSASTGDIGTGYITDDLTPQPLGLITPSTVAVVDWRIECDYAWGLDPTAPWGAAYQDNAIFCEWPATAAGGSGKDTIVEVLRGSYGTGEFELCYGNLIAITFYPHRLKYDWKHHKYVPNPFNVEAMIFNTSNNQDAKTARASLTISALQPPGPIRVISPAGATTLSDGRIQQVQDIGNGIVPGVGGIIPALDVAEVHWLDSTLDVINCNGEMAASLSLNVTYTSLTPPAFVGGCDMPIIIECTNTDTVAPKFTTTMVDSFHHNITVTDSTPTDKGLKRISWVANPAFNATVSVTWPPNDTSKVGATYADLGCIKDPALVHVHQKDSTIAVCVDFTFTDCNENSSYTTICYPGHPPPVHPDDLPPVFTLDSRYQLNPNPDTNCNAARSNWTVSDIRTYDRGLLSVDVLAGSARNMNFHLSNQVKLGDRTADFQISVVDPMQDGFIVIVATDSVVPHHVSYDTIWYCTYHDILPPSITATAAPLNGMWHVHATDSQAWDRKLDTVFFTGLVNCSVRTPLPNGWTGTAGAGTYTAVANPPLPIGDFDVVRTDTLNKSCFTAYARDSVGNWSDTVSRCSDVIPDVLCPWIVYETVSTSPLRIKVTISDDHNVYDLGIRSIWFGASHNLTLELPPPIGTKYTSNFPAINEPLSAGKRPPYPLVDFFYLTLTDPNPQDTLSAIVTIFAMDSAGNQLMCPTGSSTWSYPMTPDFNEPVILGAAPTHTALDVKISDNRTSDRGISRITLTKVTNFAPPFSNNTFDSVFHNGSVKQYDLTLNVVTKGKSSYADIWTIDTFGVLTGNPIGHTDSASVWIYCQDLRMGSKLVTANSSPILNLPVYLKWTDSIPLSQKNIKQYQFTFDLNPPSPLISFNGVNTVGTLSTGWTVTPTIPATPAASYTVTATSPGSALPNLTSSGQMDAQPLLYLQFTGASSSSPAQTNIEVTGTAGEEVSYNGGTPITVNTTPDASVTLPAPFGTVKGGTIVFQGYCSPIIGPNLKPNSISLAPTSPNPATTSAVVTYTIPEEGQVTLELYNVLGERVRAMVSEVQKQGEYKLDLSAGDLPEGTYFLRLSSGGKVVSRQVVIGH